MTAEPRSRNSTATRQSILDAARRLFIKDGYDNTGVRAIAGDAGIDAALICRYFGSKKLLFAEVLQSASGDPMQIFKGDPATCGKRAAAAVLNTTADKARHLLFLGLVIGATGSDEASQLAHEHIKQLFIHPVAEWLGGPRARERAWLICSMLMGAIIMNNIHPVGAAAIQNLGRQVQRIIDESLAA